MEYIKRLFIIKFLLLSRTTYENKEKINYLLILFPLQMVIFYFSYSNNNFLLTVLSCYVIIGAIYYQSIKGNSFLTYSSLNIIKNSKKEFFTYHIISEIITKMSFITLFLFTGFYNTLPRLLFFFGSNILYIITCYLLAEVSKLDRLYHYVFLGVTIVIPVFFFSMILNSNNGQDVIGKFIDRNMYNIGAGFIGFLCMLTLMMSKVFHKKIYLC